MRRRNTLRNAIAWLIAGLLSAGALGCQTIVVAEIPPPEHACPSDADLDRLADWLPNPPDDADLALAIEDVAGRFINAAAYCRMAERRLR